MTKSQKVIDLTEVFFSVFDIDRSKAVDYGLHFALCLLIPISVVTYHVARALDDSDSLCYRERNDYNPTYNTVDLVFIQLTYRGEIVLCSTE